MNDGLGKGHGAGLAEVSMDLEAAMLADSRVRRSLGDDPPWYFSMPPFSSKDVTIWLGWAGLTEMSERGWGGQDQRGRVMPSRG